MAKSKWKQVKVKVKGKMVTRWTDGKTFRLKEPSNLEIGLRQAATSGLKKGEYNLGRTKQWDGTKYVPVNVVRAGQKATLKGKPVVADGKGNWRTPAPNSISGYGAKVGTYKSGNRTSGTTTSNTVPEGSMNISAAGRKQAEANKAEDKAKREKALAAQQASSNNKNSSSNNTPSPAPKKKTAASKKSIVNRELAGAKTFIATYKNKKGKEGMQAAVKKMEAKLAELQNTKKSNLSIRSQAQKLYDRGSA